MLAELPCPGFAHAPHTADVLIVARGRSLEEAFEQAALGVYEVVTDTSKVEPRVERRVETSGMDLYQLLYRWIEDLLFYTDSEGLVFSRFKVEEIKRVGEGDEAEYQLRARAWGEKFNPDKHLHRTIVKAMTYAMMEIVKENGCWRVQFVIDI
ncbi:archease [Pyrodictium occultum]|uniref:Protein archease n=1 Tax=Pyrodictium occultum TaxID=2309 RepID=A0A0V8RX42_PYROC|nr:archease [Pyrodictium occultum]